MKRKTKADPIYLEAAAIAAEAKRLYEARKIAFGPEAAETDLNEFLHEKLRKAAQDHGRKLESLVISALSKKEIKS